MLSRSGLLQPMTGKLRPFDLFRLNRCVGNIGYVISEYSSCAGTFGLYKNA